MDERKIGIGRIVFYVLTAEDAKQINRRRTSGYSIAARISDDRWPIGAQAHIGTIAEEGDEFSMIVVRVHEDGSVNGQVFLDGNDCFWAQRITEGAAFDMGNWHWPVIK